MDPLKTIIFSMAAIITTASLMSRAIARDLELAGFVQTHAAVRSSNVDCPAVTECTVPFNEQRVQLKAEGGNETGNLAFLGKIDLLHDSALDESVGEVRELYADYNSDRFRLRSGRQIITWGLGDLLFINDVFAKDWVAFFSGLPLQYLKRGNDALNLDLYLGSTTLEMVVSGFRADRLPNGRQFVMASPFSPSLSYHIDAPTGAEVALRLSGNLGRWDTAVYASRGYYQAPVLLESVTEVHGIYPRLNTLGASLSGAFANGVLNLELGYYDSGNDRGGDISAIENSQLRFLAGYSRQLGQETQIGVQAYAEWMQKYAAYVRNLPAGFTPRDAVRTVATVRLTQSYLYQTLIFNLFAFVGLSEEDSYLVPSVRYAFNDNLWAELGANLFNGSRNGMLGALGDNSNLYLTVRYAF